MPVCPRGTNSNHSEHYGGIFSSCLEEEEKKRQAQGAKSLIQIINNDPIC